MTTDLPVDGDGICMACKKTPPSPETITCCTCTTPWHVPCLSSPPQTLASATDWLCPDCAPMPDAAGPVAVIGVGSVFAGSGGGLIAAIRAIEADGSLTEKEKASRRQELMSGKKLAVDDAESSKTKNDGDDMMGLLDEKFMCSFCMQLPERPVTTPCGHNFCLKCFQKWIGQSKRTCVKCRAPIPPKMASQPRINSALVVAIRMARAPKPASQSASTAPYQFIGNEDRPETAFTTERAKKAGKANACSGQIFVTIPPDHFGPILAQHDPKRNKGVAVGELWEDRMECRQWGAHFPHVAGIAGQSTYGAQSVALSGGYADDEDHGEWFLYTGSGGRDLSGNKRTNKDQSSDQKFSKLNEALRVSCKNGYPVRVVRSHKEKRSSYAPETGVRYDGIYRIEKCWRKVGIQGFKVCRYLFVRCDNEPAPWTSDAQGDRPRPLPVIKELKQATDITVRKEKPAWDYEEGKGWKWTRPPPPSRKAQATENTEGRKRGIKPRRSSTTKEKLLKEFSCHLCWKVMTLPLTTPCAHNFCKLCLLESYADQSFIRERTRGGRTLRAQKVVKKCPACPNDISDFLQNAQVNREVMDLIEVLQKQIKEENSESSTEEGSDGVEKAGEDGSDVETGEEDGSEADEETGSDEEEEVLNIVKTGAAGNKSKETSDAIEQNKLDESANGDSEVHAVNSEMEEDCEGDCQSPLKASHKRKQTVARNGGGKKPRKSEEVSSRVEDVDDQNMQDAEGHSLVKNVSPKRRGCLRKNQIQGNEPSPPSPCTQNRRVTRQTKL